jgi:hypothetical protein
MEIRSGVSFGAGIGLLFRSDDDVVLGVNRGGLPVFRYDSTAPIAFAPLALDGLCVVVTQAGKVTAAEGGAKRALPGGKVHWVSQFGTELAKPFSGELLDLQPTSKGGIWAQVGSTLMAWNKKRELQFELKQVKLFATTRAGGNAPEGVALLTDGKLLWLGSKGETLVTRQIELAKVAPVRSVTWSKEAVWLLKGADTLVRVTAEGRVAQLRLPVELYPPSPDEDRGRAIVSAVSGAIYAVSGT